MRHKNIKFAVATGSLITLLAYQNCGPVGVGGSLVSASSYTDIGFPIDVKPTYFAAMSCSGIPRDHSANHASFDLTRPEYFSFRIASDSETGLGGISLRQQFIDQVEAARKRRPRTFVFRDELRRALSENPAFVDSSLMISLINPTNLIVAANNETRVPFSFVSDDLNLSDPDLLDELSAKTDSSPLLGRDFYMQLDLRSLSRSNIIQSIPQEMAAGALAIGLNFTSLGLDRDTSVLQPKDINDENAKGAYGRFLYPLFNRARAQFIRESDAEVVGLSSTNYDRGYQCASVKMLRASVGDILYADANPNQVGCGRVDINSWRPLYHPTIGGYAREADMPPNLRALYRLFYMDAYRRLLNFDYASEQAWSSARVQALRQVGSEWLFSPNLECMIHRDAFIDDRNNRRFRCYGTPTGEIRPDAYDLNMSSAEAPNGVHQMSYCYATR